MILTYHEIEPHSASRSYSVLRAKLRRHLAALAALREAEPHLPPDITFDDGHASNHRYGAPALREANFRGTFFITAGWTGKRPGYMSVADLRDLAKEGHEIGSHGWSHALLTRCDSRALADELMRSRAFLEDCLGRAVMAISMPGGRWNNRVLAACAEAGYRRVYNSDPFRKPGPKRGVELLGRTMMRRNMDADDVISLVRAGGAKLMLLRVGHEAKCAVRRLAGDTLYQRVWELIGSRPEGR
jgi:peptidoglycan/xylan/chitin deacetylase (PgdA/CDA1 family)